MGSHLTPLKSPDNRHPENAARIFAPSAMQARFFAALRMTEFVRFAPFG